MCRYQRAPECSQTMYTSRRCRACHLHDQRERSRRVRELQRQAAAEETRFTLAEMVAHHAQNWACRSWL